jgi:hypothetical protein
VKPSTRGAMTSSTKRFHSASLTLLPSIFSVPK